VGRETLDKGVKAGTMLGMAMGEIRDSDLPSSPGA
jgi:hypothetical protein